MMDVYQKIFLVCHNGRIPKIWVSGWSWWTYIYNLSIWWIMMDLYPNFGYIVHHDWQITKVWVYIGSDWRIPTIWIYGLSWWTHTQWLDAWWIMMDVYPQFHYMVDHDGRYPKLEYMVDHDRAMSKICFGFFGTSWWAYSQNSGIWLIILNGCPKFGYMVNHDGRIPAPWVYGASRWAYTENLGRKVHHDWRILKVWVYGGS